MSIRAGDLLTGSNGSLSMRNELENSDCPAPPEAISRRLRSDEQLLWVGQPSQGFLFRPTDSFLIPVSLLWTAFFLFIVASFIASPAPSSAAMVPDMFVIVMLLIGIYLLVGRFFYDRARRRSTWYALTTSRLLIARKWPTQNLQSFDLNDLSALRLDEGFDDAGTIRLPGGNEGMFLLMGGNESWPWAGLVAPPSLEKIPNARKVYDLICRIRYERLN